MRLRGGLTKYFAQNGDMASLSSVLDGLYSVHGTPNVMQLAATRLMGGHLTYRSYEEVVDFYSSPVSQSAISDLEPGTYALAAIDAPLGPPRL
ncbi:hypothetical protein [Thermogymnomonas acidicola]|uniref:hypothetical protein n=1 Tax=Thermogymnomonas acidicola TaxID=399579 RepID=UPI00094645CB|nr:hypothetical protein [Thermogymnomonas acidicola]